MKKILLILLSLSLVTPALRAQDSGRGGSLEVTGGLNHSRFSEDVDGAACLVCWFFGANIIFSKRGPLSFSNGVNFTGSGSEYKSGEDFGEDGSYSLETREGLNYLNIPAEVRYEFGAGKIKPFVRGGGTFGLLLSAKNKTKMSFNGRDSETETDIKNRKRSTNLALSLGGGISFPLGKYHGIASVRYLIGLTNVVKDDRAPSAKTRDLTYSVGIGIPVF